MFSAAEIGGPMIECSHDASRRLVDSQRDKYEAKTRDTDTASAWTIWRMEEASLMRKLLSYVRHLFRATMKSRDPTMNELKSIMQKKSGEVNKENTQINYIQYKL